jgi:peptidoglycan/LPS O-acetylase OafA/YrhL
LLAEIEVLRAVAVLLVILHHAGALIAVPRALGLMAQSGGFASGVDLFFVISGFVISRGLIARLTRAHNQGSIGIELRRFWIRRGLRLWPAAWLWLLVTLGASFAAPAVFGSATLNLAASWAGFLHYANFRQFLTSTQGFYGASVQYWSLSVEEQFYLIFPFLTLLGRRALLLIAAVFIAGTLLCTGASSGILRFVFIGSRYGLFFFGVLIALAEPRLLFLAPYFAPLRRILRAVTVLLLLLLVRFSAAAWIAAHGLGITALTATLLVALAGCNGGLICPDMPLRRVLCWIGARSYALYLTHFPVWLLIHAMCEKLAGGLDERLTPLPRLVAFLLGAAMMLGCAEILHCYVERPCRNLGRRLANM